ncbi:VeA protein, partial [Diplocarpon rosae]
MASVARVGARRDPTIASVSRYTTAGRKLTYELRVIQQPERARACASADRRPVDPPPVVELRIFEGEGVGEDREDVTFGYGANFFLYATLEVARPMAHMRGQPAAGPTIPVLTGMPVSGMAYLDRPSEAGYFIFPDLSVRHEGIYSLSFNLYEETKDPSDRDAEPQDSPGTAPAMADPSFDWRLEIKSDAFTVYSAKKFPGLAESTVLSRTVAEQGCRVRIRRDVRMRRRDKKGHNDMEAPEDEWSRAARPIEPDTYREKPRSRGRDEGRAPSRADVYRPDSDSPLLAPAPRAEGGARNFRPAQAGSQPFAAMARYGAPQPQPQFSQPQQPPQQQQQFPPAPTAYPPNTQPHPVTRLPPLKSISTHDLAHSPPGPRSSLTQYSPPPLPTPTYEQRPVSYSQYPPPPPLAAAPLAVAPPSAESKRLGEKRTYDSVFDSSPTTHPLHNGMRPSSPDFDADEDNEEEFAAKMEYKRADGSQNNRFLNIMR